LCTRLGPTVPSRHGAERVRTRAGDRAADQSPARDVETIERRLAQNTLSIWEVDGVAVAMCGHGGRTPNGIRIGPVYTPPEHRGRGYATSLTARVSQRQLDDGRRFCFLYTDRANPTSNAIYERIGYRKVCEAAQLAFESLFRTASGASSPRPCRP
jgi:predicted GNAT family acetyltransferase